LSSLKKGAEIQFFLPEDFLFQVQRAGLKQRSQMDIMLTLSNLR